MTVLIADDMEPICRRCRKLLEKDPEISVIDCVFTGAAAVESALASKPDVILMDVEMETRTAGLAATQEILKNLPDTKIIILTVYEDDETVFNAFQLGVSDYFLKNSPQDELIACVRDAYHGVSPIRPVIAQKIRREFQRVKNSEQSFLYTLQIITSLSQGELDILDLMSRGYTRTQICEMRVVELSTVKSQIHSILQKFKMSSMNEVIATVNKLEIMDYLHIKKQRSADR